MKDSHTKSAANIKKPTPKSATNSSRAALRAQEKAKQKAESQQRLLFIFLGAALAINLVIAYFLYGLMVKEASEKNISSQIDTQIELRATDIKTFIKQNQEKLDKLSHHPAFVEALRNQDKDAFQSLGMAFSNQFENFVGFTIFVKGDADIDADGIVPIRFAELDLIRRAENREAHFVEAAKINDDWLIHFVSPIAENDSEPVLGTIMLSVNSAALVKYFSEADKSLGENILQQKFPNSIAQNIVQSGMADSQKSQVTAIPASNWQIKFTASQQLISNASESLAFWALAIGCSTALSLFLALILSRFLVRYEKNATVQLSPSIDMPGTPATPEAAAPGSLYQKQDILDVNVFDEDENILGLSDISRKKKVTDTSLDEHEVPIAIFRSYDIRGIVGTELTPALAEKIGQAAGSEALDQGEQHLIVAQDARTHSQELTTALIQGILRSGCNVINIGVVPTPVMYFATYHFNNTCSGVMVTASHNPKEYNGFKIVINNNTLADDAVMKLRTRILTKRLHQGQGEESFREIIPHYIDRIFSDVALASNLSIVIDAGNAVTGIVAPQLFEELGCNVTPLYCELDGNFPNHDPDPTQEKNLSALIAKVQDVKADIGVAFDGDGDRLVVVTPKGDIIWPDRLLMLFAKDVLARNPGADVLFDVKCSRQLNQVISGYGGRPIMWKTGHSPMKAKMIETGAIIGGEYSGHIFIKDRWYGFDDGIYAMARLLEIITLRDQNIDDIFESFPQLITTAEIKISVPDSDKFAFMQKLSDQGNFENGNIVTIDGIRVDYSLGWGLVRASNTSPALTLRFEAETDEELENIKQIFRRELLKIDNSLQLNF